MANQERHGGHKLSRAQGERRWSQEFGQSQPVQQQQAKAGDDRTDPSNRRLLERLREGQERAREQKLGLQPKVTVTFSNSTSTRRTPIV